MGVQQEMSRKQSLVIEKMDRSDPVLTHHRGQENAP